MEGLSDGATLVQLLLWFNSKRNGCFRLPLTPGMMPRCDVPNRH